MSATTPRPGEPVVSMAALLAAARAATAVSTPPTEPLDEPVENAAATPERNRSEAPRAAAA